MTLVIQIGNTDNKLTQSEWSDFCASVRETVAAAARQVHFDGCAAGDAPRQNACWVIDVEAAPERLEKLRGSLREIRQRFRQDAVAWTAGETEMV